MNSKWILAAGMAAMLSACSQPPLGGQPEPAEVKVKLGNTPEAVRKTIERELAGGELEDIAREVRDGKTVYETDIIRDGHKWEVVIAEDGTIISKIQEGKGAGGAGEAGAEGFRDSFEVDKAVLAATGDNLWLTMRPGRVLKLKSGADTLTITVLEETLAVDGARVGVLEERETKGGELIEISRNFFATDPKTGDVYYFGEDVDNYKGGKIISHDSAWRSGVDGARFGLMIPGKPGVGDRYYQEIAPRVALDRVEVVSVNERLRTPAGVFEHCLHLKETTPLESGESHKWYAPGVGMVKDDEFELAEMPAK